MLFVHIYTSILNLGLKAVQAQFYILSNAETKIVSSNMCIRCFEYYELHFSVAIC